MIKEFKDQEELQMIIFRLGCEEYAVPIMSVQEIIMKQTPTHIPKSPLWVEGVINLRGHIISIIDGKKKFLFKDSENINTADQRIIVLDVEHETIGLIVDEVSEVVHIKTKDIEDVPVDTVDENDFIMGIGKHQNRLLILISPEKFLSHAEAHDLKKLTEVTQAISQSKEQLETAEAV